MKKEIEIKVGECITLRKEVFECVESDYNEYQNYDCGYCALSSNNRNCDDVGICSGAIREDEKEVYFIKVEA